MANASVRAYTKKTASTANPWTITNPTGLTAGDLMVLAICTGGTAPSAPSGWTQRAQGGTSGSTLTATIFTKVADAADVAAGSVAVTNSAGSYLQGMLWAVQNAGSVEAANGGYNSTTSYSLSISGFDPAAASDLILCACVVNWTFVSFATANNNPTWTTSKDSSYYGSTVGEGSYASADASGDVTLTTSGGKGPKALAFVAIAPGAGSTPTTDYMSTMRGLWG